VIPVIGKHYYVSTHISVRKAKCIHVEEHRKSLFKVRGEGLHLVSSQDVIKEYKPFPVGLLACWLAATFAIGAFCRLGAHVVENIRNHHKAEIILEDK
jgi:hypothetical protein